MATKKRSVTPNTVRQIVRENDHVFFETDTDDGKKHLGMMYLDDQWTVNVCGEVLDVEKGREELRLKIENKLISNNINTASCHYIESDWHGQKKHLLVVSW